MHTLYYEKSYRKKDDTLFCFELKDEYDSIIVMEKDDLKQKLRTQQYKVIGLKLTSDNRIVIDNNCANTISNIDYLLKDFIKKNSSSLYYRHPFEIQKQSANSILVIQHYSCMGGSDGSWASTDDTYRTLVTVKNDKLYIQTEAHEVEDGSDTPYVNKTEVFKRANGVATTKDNLIKYTFIFDSDNEMHYSKMPIAD